jgi:hypothetical protein
MVPPDLRQTSCDDVITRVAHAFAAQFDPTTEVRKRRSLGCRTNRNTWVRIEVRPVERIDGQGWNGPECAAVIQGVAKPDWHQGISWLDHEEQLFWRADETQLIEAVPVKRGGTLTVDPNLSDAWWATLTTSLRTLAAFPTTRVATPTMQLITQERLTTAIHKLFPDVDSHVDEWTTAHGDLLWTNLTTPDCWILDWEDWGRAPRGYDAASLWHSSLAVPALAERAHHELRGELDTRSGRLCQLMRCAETLTAPPGYADELLASATTHAHQLVRQLTQPA